MINNYKGRNKTIFLLSEIISTVVNFGLTGAIYQTFLGMIGFDSRTLYIQSTVIQAISIAVILLASYIIQPSKSIKYYILTMTVQALLLLLYLPLCRNSSASIVYLFAISILQALITGMRTALVYNLPYMLFSDKDYGIILTAAGIGSSLLTLAMGKAFNTLILTISYITVMRYLYIIVFGLSLVEAILFLFARSIITPEENVRIVESKGHNGILEVIKNPLFYRLAFPNLARGFAYGVIDMMAIIALSLGYDENTTVTMVSVMSVVNLAILTATLVLFKKQVQSRLIVLIGSLCTTVICGIFIPNKNVFLAIYALAYAGRTCCDYGIPVIVRNMVPLEIATSYSALRMILHTAGIMLAGIAATLLPIRVLIVVTAALSVIFGVLYARYSKTPN